MKFSDNPFIPKGKASLVIVDQRISKSMEDELKNKKIEIIKTCKCDEVYDAIKYHPDIVLCYLGENKIVVAPNVYEYYDKILNPYGFHVIKGIKEVSNKYPTNIYYNIALFGKYAVHHFKHTEDHILQYIKQKGLISINVKQGYTKCSICIVDENSIITSDEGIYKEVIKHNIDCLRIEEGNIHLFDMGHGFIGGATGLLSDKEIAFLGNAKKHKDYLKIKAFLHKKDKKIISLGKDELIDLGSIIPIMTREE